MEQDVPQPANRYSSTFIGLMLKWVENILVGHIEKPFRRDLVLQQEVKQLDLSTAESSLLLWIRLVLGREISLRVATTFSILILMVP